MFLENTEDEWSFDLAERQHSNRAQKVIDNALLTKKPVCLIPNSDFSELTKQDRQKLRALYRNSVALERETGLHETYLGFPFIAGFIDKSTYVRGPLVLFPILIEYIEDIKTAGWYISFSADKMPILNRAILGAVENIHKFHLPESFVQEFENLIDEIESGTISTRKNPELSFLEKLVNLLNEYKFPFDPSKSILDKTEALKPVSIIDNQYTIGMLLQ